MASITLDSIRDAIDAKYGSYDIELGDTIVSLLNPLRLSPEARKALGEVSLGKDDESEDDGDAEEHIQKLVDIVQIVAATPKQANDLIKALSPYGYVDVAMLSHVVSEYMEQQKVGEASASPS